MSGTVPIPTFTTMLSLPFPPSHQPHAATRPSKATFAPPAQSMHPAHHPLRPVNDSPFAPSRAPLSAPPKRPPAQSPPAQSPPADTLPEDPDISAWLLSSDAPPAATPFPCSLPATGAEHADDVTPTPDYPDVFGHLHLHDLMDVDSTSMAFNAHDHLASPTLLRSPPPPPPPQPQPQQLASRDGLPGAPLSPAPSTLPCSPPASSVPSTASFTSASRANCASIVAEGGSVDPSLCSRSVSHMATHDAQHSSRVKKDIFADRECRPALSPLHPLKKPFSPPSKRTIPLTLPLTPASAMLALRKRSRDPKNTDAYHSVSGADGPVRSRRRDGRTLAPLSVASKSKLSVATVQDAPPAHAPPVCQTLPSRAAALPSDDPDKSAVVLPKCARCSMSAKRTPMMRKGPDGCRSLCNACGLKWSRHGVF